MDSEVKLQQFTKTENNIENGGHDNPSFNQGDIRPVLREEKLTVSIQKVDPTSPVASKYLESNKLNNDLQEGNSDEDDDNEDSDDDGGACCRGVKRMQVALYHAYERHKRTLWNLVYAVLFVLYVAYVVYSVMFRFGDEGSWRLVICSSIAALYLGYCLIESFFGETVKPSYFWKRLEKPVRQKIQHWTRMILSVLLAIGAIVYIVIYIAMETPENLVSLGGLAVFILLFYLFSHNPSKVKWQPVFGGVIIQFYFALIILRWDVGYQAFQWLGDRITEFLAYTDNGAKFVFGNSFQDHFFAFKVLPVIIFFSSFVSVCYYLGIMQFLIRNLARFIAGVMGTSPAESLNAAGNIFVGQSEAPLMIRPFLAKMTKSELHAICTGGFATVAGSTMGGYIAYKVPANHLLSASVMSAPAALAMAKLFYPETKKTKTGNEVYNIPSGQERNIIEAAAFGASQAIKLVANVAANLVAFIALVEFLNQTLIWFGNRAGMEKPDKELTFQFICSYVFYPLAFLMGVDTKENNVFKVAELIGYKTFINEFYAYEKLSVYINNRENLTWYESLPTIDNSTYTGRWRFDGEDIVYSDFNHTLKNGVLTDRSVVISTYALCGFANIASIGIMLGALGAMAPNQRSALAQVVVRAMIAGTVACFMTACIAGLLYVPGG